MKLSISLVLLLSSCMVQEVDLRKARQQQQLNGDRESCAHGQRFDAEQGCVPCQYREPHPVLACPCGWEYLAAELPYCDAADAYYECDACQGDIHSCNAYDADSGTSRDCTLLGQCCVQLAADPGSTPCCQPPDELACVFDSTAGSEGAQYLVGCLPAYCCEGEPCPNGDECTTWQSCDAGTCTPACEPTVEECIVVESGGALSCVCEPPP